MTLRETILALRDQGVKLRRTAEEIQAGLGLLRALRAKLLEWVAADMVARLARDAERTSPEVVAILTARDRELLKAMAGFLDGELANLLVTQAAIVGRGEALVEASEKVEQAVLSASSESD